MKKKTIIFGIFLIVLISVVLVFLKEKNRVKRNSALNLIVFTLDTTRADRVSAYGYKEKTTPNIDKLAEDGVLFLNARTSVPLTLPSHCSIFTGTYPLYHKVRNNGNYFLNKKITTLAEVLKSNGFTTAAFVSAFVLDSRYGINQGFDYYDDNIKPQLNSGDWQPERRAKRIYQLFSKWFANNYRQHFFVWLHFYDPHMPYDPPEDKYIMDYDDPYDGEIAYMDHYIGEIINLLREKGVLKNTLIVFAGDHGEAFGEHKEIGHGVFCYEEALKVPFIMYAPSVLPEHKIVKKDVNLIDLMPTVLDILNVKIPKQVEGMSLIPLIEGKKREKRLFYFETFQPFEDLGCAPLYGVFDGTYKYIELPKPELYNILKDKNEAHNIYYKEYKISKNLKEELYALIKKYESSSKFGSKKRVSYSEREKLASLGYVSTVRTYNPEEKLPDPKDKVESEVFLLKAKKKISEGEIQEAINLLKKSVEINSKNISAYTVLGDVFLREGKVREAMDIFNEAMIENPEDIRIKIKYATSLILLKQYDKVINLFRTIKETENAPLNMSIVYGLIGLSYERLNNIKNAVVFYEKAVKISPKKNVGLAKKLIHFYLMLKDYKSLVRIFKTYESDFEKAPVVLYEAGLGFLKSGDKKSAENCFSRSLKYREIPGALFYLGLLEIEKNNLDKGRAFLKKFLSVSLKTDPRRQIAFNVLKNK